MANFNYSALVSPGGLSEQLGHLAGVIAGANATNRATDEAHRRTDVDLAFRQAQLEHYKQMEARQGLSGAMNPLQQAAIQEHQAKAGYYDHLTNKATLPKPPAMVPGPQQQLAMPGVVSDPLATPDDPAEAPSTMIRHIQDTVVGPTVKDKLAHGASPSDAVRMQKELTDAAMEAQGYPYDPNLGKYTKPKPMSPETPPWGMGTVGGQPPFNQAMSNAAQPAAAPPEGGMGTDTDAYGNVVGGAPASPPVAPGGLGAAMAAPPASRGLDALMPPAAFDMQSMFGSAPPASAPAPAAPPAQAPAAPAPNGKVIPGSALKAKAAQLYGGDLNAAMAHAQALGYTIDPSR